jgi:hypothetical protein
MIESSLKGINLGSDIAKRKYYILGKDFSRLFVKHANTWYILPRDRVSELCELLSPSSASENELLSRIHTFYLPFANEMTDIERETSDFNMFQLLLDDCYSFSTFYPQFAQLFDNSKRCKVCQDLFFDQKTLNDHLKSCSCIPQFKTAFDLECFKIAKSFLLDLEMAIPTDCYVPKKALIDEESSIWRESVKMACSCRDLISSVADLESRLDRLFMSKDYNRTLWKNLLSSSSDLSSLFVLFYELDQMIRYGKVRRRVGEDSSSSDSSSED